MVIADQFRSYAKPVRRAYSIASSAAQKDFLDITIKREVPGLMSMRLTEVPVGTELEVSDPAGKYYWEPALGTKILLLGAGSGITPLHSIARTVFDQHDPSVQVKMFYSVRTPEDIIYRDLWQPLVDQHSNFKFHLTVTRAKPTEWSGNIGRITADFVRAREGEVADHVAFICGPGPMVLAMEEVCRQLGLPEEQIHSEKW